MSEKQIEQGRRGKKKGSPSPTVERSETGSRAAAGSGTTAVKWFKSPRGFGYLEGGHASASVFAQFTTLRTTTTVNEAIDLERKGAPSSIAVKLRDAMGLSTEDFTVAIGMPIATYKNKVREKKNITGAPGYALLGFAEFLDIAQSLVPEDQRDTFDTAKWLGEWLRRPQPAFAGKRGIDLVDTPAGRELVANALGSLASGSYL